MRLSLSVLPSRSLVRSQPQRHQRAPQKPLEVLIRHDRLLRELC